MRSLIVSNSIAPYDTISRDMTLCPSTALADKSCMRQHSAYYMAFPGAARFACAQIEVGYTPPTGCDAAGSANAAKGIRLRKIERAWAKKNKPTKRTALTVSAIFAMHIITARRRLQNAATVSLFSISLSFAEVLSTPIAYSFERSWPSIFDRKGSCAGRRDSRWVKERSEPQSLLYLDAQGRHTLVMAEDA